MRRCPGLSKVIQKVAVVEKCPFEICVLTQLFDDVPLDAYERYIQKTTALKNSRQRCYGLQSFER
jgi:hypothetical protein